MLIYLKTLYHVFFGAIMPVFLRKNGENVAFWENKCGIFAPTLIPSVVLCDGMYYL
jgi:hypothetical protein